MSELLAHGVTGRYAAIECKADLAAQREIGDMEQFAEPVDSRADELLAYGHAYTLSYTLLHLSDKFPAATGTYGRAHLTQNQVAARSCWFESGQGHQSIVP